MRISSISAAAAVIFSLTAGAALAADMKGPAPSASCKSSPMQAKHDQVMLNPQPEPPGVQSAKIKGQVHPGDAVKLNPQPEPPGVQGRTASKVGMARPGDAVAFNPQPDPPGCPVIAAPHG